MSLVRGLIQGLGLAFAAVPAVALGQNVNQVTVHCDIKNEDKEKPCSFKVTLKKDGKELYSRSGWSLEEGWDDNTNHETSSDDISGLSVARKGRYVLDIEIDNGKRCDVECEWYVDVVGSDGKTITSKKYRHFYRNRQTTDSFSFDIGE